MSVALGIDIGGTAVKFVALSARGEILGRWRVPTDESSAEGVPAAIRSEIRRMEDQFGVAQPIGVACPGLVRRGGVVIHWMKGRLNLLENLNWEQVLGRDAPVPVINDGHAALKAEIWLGAGRGCRDLVMLTLGTGVGGGILSDGRVLSGHLGRAGHLGHVSLNPSGEVDIANTPGSLEDAIGNCTVARRSAGRYRSTADLVRAHLEGDPLATQVWLTSVHQLAVALASIINALDPQRIILGGGIAAHARDALFVPLRERMNACEWRPTGVPVEIVSAELGDEAGAIGAAKHAMEVYDAS
ncbi:MAG: ROK family protein [Acidobacteriota bacterium]